MNILKKTMTFFFIFLLSVQSLLLSSTDLTSEEDVSVPNPKELNSNWWNYYNVDATTLTERREKTELLYREIQQKAEADPEIEKINILCNGILAGLQSLIQVKSTPEPTVVSVRSFPEKYSYKEWISLGTKALEEKKKLEQLSAKLDLMTFSYESGSKYLDTQFATYLSTSKKSTNRLIYGLTIITRTILLQVEKIQASHLKIEVESSTAHLEMLEEEINTSYNKVDFNSVSIKDLEKELESAKMQENQSYESFFLTHEKTFLSTGSNDLSQEEKEKNNTRLFEARLVHETSRLHRINLEAQILIIKNSLKEISLSRSSIQEKMQIWLDIAEDVKQELPFWENTSEIILEQQLNAFNSSQNGSSKHKGSIKESIKVSESILTKIQTLESEIFLNNFLMSQLLQVKQNLSSSLGEKISGLGDSVVSSVDNQTKWLHERIFKIGGFPVTPLSLFKFLSIIVFCTFLAKFVRYSINLYGNKQKQNKQASLYVLSNFLYYCIILLGVFIAGASIGADLTAFAFIAGAFAVWVGFGLQAIFNSVISGIIVLLTRLVRIHDYIQLDSGEKGTVKEINLRTSVLLADDGYYIVIPNSELISKKFYNHAIYLPNKRIHIPFRIGLDESKEKVSKIAIEAAKTVSSASGRHEPELWINGYGDNCINVELVVWINSYAVTKSASKESEYFWAIDSALRENGISIPVALR
jgi:potassium-dependent mechanosensitive channel